VWWLNLAATPQATVQVEGQTREVVASEAPDAERDRLWEILERENLFCSRHRANTDRRIPIVLLNPVDG